MDPAQKNSSSEAPKTAEEVKAEMHSSVMADYNTTKYDYTIIFQTQDTGEGVDRGDLGFNNEVFHYLPHIEHPGKIIAGLSFSGAADIRNFTEHADAILYNVPPGQRYAEGWLSILFGKVNPSGKLAFTIPHDFKELNIS